MDLRQPLISWSVVVGTNPIPTWTFSQTGTTNGMILPPHTATRCKLCAIARYYAKEPENMRARKHVRATRTVLESTLQNWYMPLSSSIPRTTRFKLIACFHLDPIFTSTHQNLMVTTRATSKTSLTYLL